MSKFGIDDETCRCVGNGASCIHGERKYMPRDLLLAERAAFDAHIAALKKHIASADPRDQDEVIRTMDAYAAAKSALATSTRARP